MTNVAEHTEELTAEERAAAIAQFDLPAEAVAHLTHFYTPTEAAFAAAVGGSSFDRRAAAAVLERIDASHDWTPSPSDPAEFLAQAYRRGVINLADEQPEPVAQADSARPTSSGVAANPAYAAPDSRYVIGDFYGRLDVYAISDQPGWLELPAQVRKNLDDWYFQAYMDGLDPDRAKPPTSDTVMTLKETLDFIDAQDRPIYVNTCDCRSLAGSCNKPRRVCLTYKSGPNTFCDRGLSDALTKEEAKDVVRMADKAGLMHTVNPNGICNCCGDCCYLFRGQRYRDSLGTWPIAPYLINIDHDACISCGKCARRCHFGVFELKRDGKRRELLVDADPCVGCGICVNTCPTHALSLVERNSR